MMSLDTNIGASKPGTNNKDGTQTSGGGGSGGSGGGKKSSSSMRAPPEQAPPPPPPLKCPRCDSPNTKFCYYNNYNLSQPRHFCKTCRRYWTKGGALRSVPIGGGCRKNKKMKSSSHSSSSSSRFSGDSSSSCSDIGGLKFFNGLSPAMDFQLGGLNLTPRTGNLFNNSSNSQFSLFGGSSSSSFFNLDPLGFNGLGFQEMGNAYINQSSNIASSIESLSYINQDLHWKLQQQRLGLLFGGGGGGGGGGEAGGGEFDENQHKESSSVVSNSIQLDHNQNVHQGQKLLQPILFQNLEISPKANEPPMGDSGKDCTGSGGSGGGNSLATEWFFENCYAPGNVNVNPTPTNSNNAGNDQNGINNWNGIQDWSNLNQYSALP